MKRLIVIAILFLFIGSGICKAQEKAFVFGFNLSPNLGWLKTDTKGFNNEGVIPGVSWGFITEFHLLENYAISTGFNVAYIYGKMNFQYNYSIENVNYPGHLTRKYKLQYLQIPLALKMKTNELGKIRIYGIIGLGTSFLIRGMAKDEFKKNAGGTYTDEKANIYDDVVFFRESLIIGAGIETAIAENVILVTGVKFDNGFMNIMQEDKRYIVEDEPKVINNFIELTIGVLF